MGLLLNIYQKLKQLSKEDKPERIQEKYSKYMDIDESTILNKGCTFYIHPGYATLNKKCVSIGKKSLLTAHFVFETNSGNISIGNNVYMGGVSLISKTGIHIGNNVTMAWGITLYDHDAHSTDWAERAKDNERCYDDFVNHNGNLNVTKNWDVVKSKKIVIEDNVWVGFDVLILKGVTVGKGAVIAAKSVVTKDVEPWTLVAGNPAVEVKKLTAYK